MKIDPRKLQRKLNGAVLKAAIKKTPCDFVVMVRAKTSRTQEQLMVNIPVQIVKRFSIKANKYYKFKIEEVD